MTKLNRILVAAGVVFLLAGFALGLRSTSASGVNCGSVFRPAAGITPMACDGQLSRSSTLVLVLLGLGVAEIAASVALSVARGRAGQRLAR